MCTEHKEAHRISRGSICVCSMAPAWCELHSDLSLLYMGRCPVNTIQGTAARFESALARSAASHLYCGLPTL